VRTHLGGQFQWERGGNVRGGHAGKDAPGRLQAAYGFSEVQGGGRHACASGNPESCKREGTNALIGR
jgi:hypothetical protein